MKTTKDKNCGKLLKIIRNRQMVEMHSLIKHYALCKPKNPACNEKIRIAAG